MNSCKFSELQGRHVVAKDGQIGHLTDVLFGDRFWDITYFVVETGNWLNSSKVVLAPQSVAPEGLTDDHGLRMNLTLSQIENAPPYEEHLPVGHQYENDLASHYNLRNPLMIPTGLVFPYPDVALPSLNPAGSIAELAALQEGQGNYNRHLRSIKDLLGYKIATKDKEVFGEVAQAILDLDRMLLIDLVLDSRRWLPGGKKIVCSPLYIKKLDEEDEVIHVDLEKDVLLDGPSFDWSDYGKPFQKEMVDHYWRFVENVKDDQNKKQT